MTAPHCCRLLPRSPRLVRATLTATEAVGSISPGFRLVGVTKGEFSLLDLVVAFLKQTGPAHFTISTWSVGSSEADNVKWLRESGSVLSCVLITDRAFPVMKPDDQVNRAEDAFGRENVRVVRTHAKFVLIRNAQWNIAVRSSMNFNRNPRFEQFDVDDDPAICDFLAEHVRELLELLPAGMEADDETIWRGFNASMKNQDEEPADEYDWLQQALDRAPAQA